MSELIPQEAPATCNVFRTTDEDLETVAREDAIRMLNLIYLVREFESRLLDLQELGLINGPVHTCHGQEAISAAAAVALQKSDLICTSHRPHGDFLAKAVAYYAPEDHHPLRDPLTPPMQEAVDKTLAEILGLAEGWCAGRGGSMHLCDGRSGNLGSNGIVGGNIPMATGAAWAQKHLESDRVVVSFFGDGAFEQGCFHEVANMSALWGIPVVFFVENNQYAVATSTSEHSFIPDLALRGCAYGFDTMIVDGMDPINVYLALRQVTARMRQKPFPCLIEGKTYRLYHHAGRMAGSAFGYRTEKEEAQWSARDPVVAFPKRLMRQGLLTEEQDERLRRTTKDCVAQAVQRCIEEKNGALRIVPTKWPSLDSVTKYVRSERDVFRGVRFVEREDFTETREIAMVEAIAAAMLHTMEQDNRVIVLGEEVANLGGGCFGATRGIKEVFPQRLINTPISEAGFVGMAGGAACVGLRPIVEIMFPDFAFVAGDQLFNQIAKLHYMYGGKLNFPLVARTRCANGLGGGGQHSTDPCGLFALFSGWRVIAPSTPFDYIGLFNTAMRFEDPTLVVEYGSMYQHKGQIPAHTMDYYVEYGKAKVVHEGTDVTIVTYLAGVEDCLQVAREIEPQGISAEIIDLRTLDYVGMDYDTIGRSVHKTGRVLVVEKAPRSMSLGARISDEVQERFFYDLDGPIIKIAGLDVPNPVSRVLEEACLPTIQQIMETTKAVARREL